MQVKRKITIVHWFIDAQVGTHRKSNLQKGEKSETGLKRPSFFFKTRFLLHDFLT